MTTYGTEMPRRVFCTVIRKIPEQEASICDVMAVTDKLTDYDFKSNLDN